MNMQRLLAHALDAASLETVQGGRSLRFVEDGRSWGFDLFGFGRRGTVRAKGSLDTHEISGDNLTITGSQVLDQSGNVLLDF